MKKYRARLEWVAQALLEYDRDHNHLPPPYLIDSLGRPIHSWRVLLMPFLEFDAPFRIAADEYDFAAPWDAPTNSRYRNANMSHKYCCDTDANGSCNSSFLCLAGGSLWPSPQKGISFTSSNKWPNKPEGGVLPKEGRAILIVEIVGSDIPWTKPEDISLSELIASIARRPKWRPTPPPYAADCGGRTRKSELSFLDSRTDMEEIKKFWSRRQAA